LRFGYPYAWGAGLTAGLRFQGKTIREEVIIREQPAHKEEPRREQAARTDSIEQYIIRIGDKQYIDTQPVIFRPNYPDFEGLCNEVLKTNNTAFKFVAFILNTFPEYRLEVEGHANPTTMEGGAARAREEVELMQLSEQRAQRVVEELAALGVNRGRMSVVAKGGSNTKVPFDDYDNVWKNRRVNFILIRN
jgi:hypothetical protein